MPSETYATMDIEYSGGSKKGLSLTLKVAIGCSVLVAVGLAVGLGVGLSKDAEIVYITATTIKTPPKDTTATTTDAVDSTTPTATTMTPTVEATTVPDATGKPWGSIRLPMNIIPSHYALTLVPDLETDTFTGETIITFNVMTQTQYVMLHAHPNLVIDSATLMNSTGNDISFTQKFRVPDYHYYVMDVGNELDLGEYTLTMEFNSRLDYTLAGLYTSKYTDDEGNEFKIMSSDMEPSDARRAYPCFDEPAMKVNYTTTIIHDSKYYALSNMDVDTETVDQPTVGMTTTKFTTSVPMPTYLGCFVVCNYSYVENTTSNGLAMRVYAPKHHVDAGRADYANKVSVVIMEAFENAFNMSFHLPKCDQIAIPDFSSGAMENWGLITYRETALLWDPQESSTYYKQRVCAVIAHELAHMWFGNAVTLDWWNSLWLNEGFASYFEYLGVDAAEPDWQIFKQLVNEKQSTMRVDSSVSSSAIVPPIEKIQTPGEAGSMFSTITYSKGASILSMMRDNIGDDLFFGSLQMYLKDREYGNAVTQDLWDSMQQYITVNIGGIDIKTMMDPWIMQNGFPLISANFDDSLQVTVSQTQMLSDPNANLSARADSIYNYVWPVYIKAVDYELVSGEDSLLLNDSSAVSTSFVGVTDNSTAVKLNPKLMKFYRVNYDANTWKNLFSQLETNFTVFAAEDRSNIVDDAFQLARAQILQYADALEVTNYLDMESEADSYIVWDAFSDGSGYMRRMLESTEIYPNFQKYFLTKVKPVADQLGWDTSQGTHMEKRNRELTLALALRYGDEEAKNNATAKFDFWMDSVDDINSRAGPDVRSLVYRYGVAEGSKGIPQWNFMLDQYTTELVATEKDALLYGLTQVQNTDLLMQLLEYSKNESIIRTGDFFTCVTRISYTPLGRNLAWTWYTINWDYLIDRFGADSRQVGRLGGDIVSDFNTEAMYNEVEMWFAQMTENDAGKEYRTSALNEIKENIAWMNDNQDDIAGWLNMKLNAML